MPAWLADQLREDAMIEIIEILHQEHRSIEKLLGVLERELSVFDRGDRPDYELVLAVIDYFKGYPDSCHHSRRAILWQRRRSVIFRPNIGRERDVCNGLRRWSRMS
jgi:hypothetical protein